MQIRTHYNYRVARHDRPVVVIPKDEISRVKQEFKEECDINVIVARYKKTGMIPDEARRALARYGDVSRVPSYQEMHDRIIAADEAFMLLPAKLRAKLENKPGKLIQLSETAEGRELLKAMGFGKETPPSPPGEVPSPAAKAGGEAGTASKKQSVKEAKTPKESTPDE